MQWEFEKQSLNPIDFSIEKKIQMYVAFKCSAAVVVRMVNFSLKSVIFNQHETKFFLELPQL